MGEIRNKDKINSLSDHARIAAVVRMHPFYLQNNFIIGIHTDTLLHTKYSIPFCLVNKCY